MKKRLVMMIAAVATCSTLLTACGGNDNAETPAPVESETPADTTGTDATGTDTTGTDTTGTDTTGTDATGTDATNAE